MRVVRLAARVWTAVLLTQALLVAALLAARLLVLPQVSSQPRLLAAVPADGAAGVSPRARLALRFSEPMNPPSVERALRIEPPLRAALRWDAARTTLTISPTESLAPDTAYRVTVGGAASGRLFRPLAGDVAVSFHTAPAPAVVAVFPADGATSVPLDALVSVRFSQPMVPAADLAQPATLHELRFDPPIAGRTTWLDQRTVLFRPDAPLQPGTLYVATLEASLDDLSGGRLGREFAWTFRTPVPRVLTVDPPQAGRLAGPRAPLRITLSSPLGLDTLDSALSLTPPTAGNFAAAILPDGTQLVTFTPALDWQPGVTYRAELRSVMTDAGPAALPLNQPFAWTFTAPPQPALVGRFPGEGQVLPAGRELRLIFSTAMDAERLRAAISFSPPAGELRVTTNNTEARIAADLRAATPYTVTLPPDLTDRAGVPLGREYQLRFLTAPAAPALGLPQAQRHVAYVTPGPPAALLVRRTNLSALSFDLYRLDAETVVRALGFRESDWTAFQPERYGQLLLRSWSVQLADPLNAQAEDAQPVALADGALPPGAYFLRVRTPEGPRADTILLASNARLTLQRGDGDVLVWATDVVSDTARAGLPLALYQGGALVQQGASDAAGLWRVSVSSAARPLVVVATGDQPAAAASYQPAPGESPAAYRIFLTADRAAYRPGERIALGGFVRRVVTATLELPPPGLRVALAARRQGQELSIAAAEIALADDGAFRGELALAGDAPPGEYTLVAALAGASAELPFTLAGLPAPLAVRVAAAPGGLAAVEAVTPEGLPAAGAVVSWTLAAELAPLLPSAGFRFGDEEAAPAPVPPRSGVNVVGPDGRLLIPLDAGQTAAPLRFHLAARVAEPGGPATEVAATLDGGRGQVYVGIRLPSRVLSDGTPGAVELLAVDADGRPRPGAAMRLEVYRRTWETAQQPGGGSQLTPRDELLRARDVSAGDDGTALVELPLAAGEYRVRAAAAGQPATAAASLWATRSGFVGWGALSAERPLLIADRDSYRPGDTATLLLAAPASLPEALVTLARPGEITGTVRAIRAGEPLTVTLTAADAPGVRVAVLTPAADGESAEGAGAVLLAEATLPVAAEAPPLDVALASAAASYAPGDTALLTVTTMVAGAPAPASVMLAAANDPAAGSTPHTAYWNATLRTGPDGTAQLQIPLPAEATVLRVTALAASDGRVGQGTLGVRVGPPLTARLVTPPFLRYGDESEVALAVTSTAPVTQQVRVALERGPDPLLVESPAEREAALAPGEAARLRWRVLAPGWPRSAMSARLRADGEEAAVSASIPILPPGTAAITAGGALVNGQADIDLPAFAPGAAGWGWLEVEAVPTRGALVRQAVAALAALDDRGTLDEAGLLLLAASQSETRQEAIASAARLTGLQNHDGGWGWWPRTPSHPFATAAALEALAAARAAEFPLLDDAIVRGLDALRTTASDDAARADLRAYALYVLSRSAAADAAALASLAADPSQLGPVGAAYLLLARTPGEARADRQTLARLESLARRDSTGAFWSAPPDSTVFRSDVALTGLAAQALAHARPDDPLAAEARRWLAAHRPVGGWQAGHESARGVMALAPALPGSAAGATVALDGLTLIEGAPGDSAVRSAALQAGALRDGAALTVRAPGGALVSLRVTRAGGAVTQRAGDIALLREYLDPLSGRPLDPSTLRAGQLVRVRLTLVASGARVFVHVEEPIPAGASLVDLGGGGFEHVARRGDRLVLSSALLAPGVSEHSYLLRAGLAGRFDAPAPLARVAGGAEAGRGNAGAWVVAASE